MESRGDSRSDRLESWKEVAAHFRRSVRTVTRWEREEGLPVHRQPHDKRGTIYAYRQELDAWLEGRAEAEARLRRRRLRLAWLLGVVALVLAGGGVWWSARGKGRGVRSVAVAPFLNETGDAEMDGVAAGLGEGVARELGHTVKTVRYRRVEEARGDAILLARLMKREGRLLLSAELADGRNNTLIWSEKYERGGGDLRGVQEDLVKAVAARVRRGRPAERRGAAEATGAEAYRMYLRGRHEWNKRTGEGMRAAVRYFRSAIEEDPGYAAAYAGLGQAYALLSYYTADAAKETAPKARAAAMKAMELDATLAEAYGALAYVEMDYYWDWGSAERNFRRALELDPGWADGHHWFAEYLTAMGRLGEASKEYERALELDPLSPIIANNQTHVYWFSRQYERAASHCRKVVAMDARFPNAHSDLGMALLALGRTEEAIGELESAARLGGGPMNGLGRLGYGYARVGRGAEARKILEQLRGERAHNGGGMMAMVLVHVGLGEEARALDWLEMARTAHAPYLRSIWKDPVYDALRGEARFRAVLRGMNLGEERGEPREDE